MTAFGLGFGIQDISTTDFTIRAADAGDEDGCWDASRDYRAGVDSVGSIARIRSHMAAGAPGPLS